ncbi:citrulline utilization hydrolase CtlX [Psychromonas sp. Urea-02u-13]|uniref:citrulline utilization hydrolase CtlX n=1 Tax=Psychromonas sp. Urea-02u-13 TaxID=2058326 RepID=UPI000C32809F|nr:arginine deiminase-related protein [Psychromonas sp. Urea-02u-13]PKG38210.1 amidinotransferase [Psychromonas sp. Urea-02u-13]
MALIQAPNAVVMIRPWTFLANPETAVDNHFQDESNDTKNDVALHARLEVDALVELLQKHHITVHLFDDFGDKNTPDSVFPNNWFSTHSGGHIALYPMYSVSRRREKRSDIIDMLKAQYRVQDVVDFSGLEWDNLFLEGTGAMVLDNINRVAYSAKSHRASEVILERFCTLFMYEPMAFDTQDAHGDAIYHTNVMMCICSKMVLICSTMIKDTKRREAVLKRLVESGLTIVELTMFQVENFAANAIELTGNGMSYLLMSERAKGVLTAKQTLEIEKYSTLLSVAIPTIELAGGSVRCMVAGVHLSPREKVNG